MTLVNPNQAARPEMLSAYPQLFKAYLELCPNGKLPSKHLDNSLVAAHAELGCFKIEQGIEASKPYNQACAVGLLIRQTMAKYRELAMQPAKKSVYERQVMPYKNF